MLHPGNNSGAGSGLLLSSSSLQPQTVFRQTKASFSVKRPSMTVLKMNTISSFSQNAEMKYRNGPGLLHLHPASSSESTPSVQRTPAPMPLPSSGGSPDVQNAGDTVSSGTGISTSGVPAYPPKSERRPVVFDRSDGPSDFEKRLMASKKQKADMEAKQRGPDRRRVRTERIEISPGSSNEIQREILDTNSESLFKRINRAVQQAAGNQVSEPEKKERTESARPRANKGIASVPANAVQREIDGHGATEQPEADDGPVSSETVQREMRSKKKDAAVKPIVRREPIISPESDKSNRPIAETKVPGAEIQREPVETAESIKDSTHETENRAARMSAPEASVQHEALKTAEVVSVQREILKTDEPVEKLPNEAEKQAVQKQTPEASVQREILKTAEPVEKLPNEAEKQAAKEQAPEASVQREILKTAEPVKKLPSKTEKQAVQKQSPEASVQREILKTAKPVEKLPNEAGKQAVQKQSPESSIQREALKTAQPIKKTVDQIETPTVQKPAPDAPIQREVLKAVPVDKPTDQKSTSEASVQREPMKNAELIEKAPDQTERQAVLKSVSQSSIQREALKTAQPNKKTVDQIETPTVQKPASDTTVQREVLKTAEPNEKPEDQSETPTVQKPAPEASVQRESLKTAQPIKKTVDQIVTPTVQKPASDTTVQREVLKTAEPNKKSEDQSETPTVQKPAPEASVQREPLETAEPVAMTHETSEMPLPKHIAKQTGSGDTVEREFDANAMAEGHSRSVPAKALPVRSDKAGKQTPAAVPVRHSDVPDMSLTDIGKRQSSGGVIQRETDFDHAETVPEKGLVSPTVEREPDEDLQSLLSRLPKRYDMPQAQIEAIRSGKPYSGNQNSSSSAKDTVVRREFSGSSDRSGEQTGARKPIPDRQASEAAVRNSVQREPELVLPKKHGGNAPENKKAESVIHREIQRSTEQSANSAPDAGRIPDSGNKPHSFFGQNGFVGNGFRPSDNRFPGVQTGLVQRELLDSPESETVQREPMADTGAESDISSASQALEDKIDEARVPVTAKQLDRLADKLVPRIKRMMRAEMERSVFR